MVISQLFLKHGITELLFYSEGEGFGNVNFYDGMFSKTVFI